MSAKYKAGDKVWFDGGAWEIVNVMEGAAIWRDTPMYLGRKIVSGGEFWIHESDIRRRMTKGEVVAEILRGSDGAK